MQGNINIPDSNITTNLSFRQLVLMNMQQLTNFPYIEKDFDALTDYELLCLVVKFLNDVIANQNEQNDSITRMYKSFLALQDYVNNTKDEVEDAFNSLDNYVRTFFENLDVQEEINNKLDQMLEDGTLTEIIQQFLQSTAIWGFDKINDMKAATNLIDGSYAKVLGKDEINDGFQVIYKIRERTQEDVIDDVNIVLLNNGLIAEKIKNYSTQDIEDFVLYAFFDEKNSNLINLFISKDNLHLQQLKLTNQIYGRDPSLIYYNDKFYIAVTNYTETYDFVIYESSDLVNFERHEINLGLYNAEFPKRWCPDFFIDSDNKLYVFISRQYAAVDTLNLEGKFKTYISECLDIDTLTFDAPIEITLNNPTGDNYIDPKCIKVNNTYHLLLKNDSQEYVNITHFTSNNLTSFTYESDDYGQFGKYIEGQFIYEFKGEYILGCEKYAERNGFESNYRIKTTKNLSNFTNYKTMYVDKLDISHGSAFVITDKNAKNIIFNNINYNFRYNYDFVINNKNNYMICNNTMAHAYTKGRYLKIMSIYPRQNNKAFSIMFRLSDNQRYYFDSLIHVAGKYNNLATPELADYYTIQLDGKLRYNLNYKQANLHGKVMTIPNNTTKSYDVFLDLNDYTEDLTVMMDLISTNLFDDDIVIYADLFTDTLPSSPGSMRDPKRCLNAFSNFNTLYIDNTTRNKLTFKFTMPNGAFKLFGHADSGTANKTYDYTVNIINGGISPINNNPSLEFPLTFTVDDYTDAVYTISVTGLRNYSGFSIILPNDVGSSILDYTLSNVE